MSNSAAVKPIDGVETVLGIKGWLQACAIAAIAAFSAVATRQPAAAAVMVVIGLIAFPLDVGDRRHGRRERRRTPATVDPELERLEAAVERCRDGRLTGHQAIDSYIALAEWRVRNRAPVAQTRALLQEALDAATAAQDWVGEMRFEAMLSSLDRHRRRATA